MVVVVVITVDAGVLLCVDTAIVTVDVGGYVHFLRIWDNFFDSIFSKKLPQICSNQTKVSVSFV